MELCSRHISLGNFGFGSQTEFFIAVGFLKIYYFRAKAFFCVVTALHFALYYLWDVVPFGGKEMYYFYILSDVILFLNFKFTLLF